MVVTTEETGHGVVEERDRSRSFAAEGSRRICMYSKVRLGAKDEKGIESSVAVRGGALVEEVCSGILVAAGCMAGGLRGMLGGFGEERHSDVVAVARRGFALPEFEEH